MPREVPVDAVLAKAQAGGARPEELAALRRRLEQLANPGAGQLPGDELTPIEAPPRLADLPQPSARDARAALDRVAVVKLNGGLGTSMGLDAPKSLLEVRPGVTFLDVIARQVLALREQTGARLPLLLMHSAATRGPSLDALAAHDALALDGLPLDFVQGREPKLRADTLAPVDWPADPALEWCPPGHGDVYVALAASGALDALLEQGITHALISNADNLGARADARIAAWLQDDEVPFLMEVVRGTPADRKGGHLARRDGRLVLRETAQVPEGDGSFGDVDRWRSYNSNDLWLDLRVLRDLLDDDPAGPALPLIVNAKTVDPGDPASTPVLQLETAMGAAIGAVDGARALEVPRTRFVPVKTTDDLLVVRSDAYALEDDGRLVPAFGDGPGPFVALGPGARLLRDFEARFPAGPPSLEDARRLVVEGEVTFGAGVRVEGDVTVTGPRHVADGEVLRG